MRGEPTPPPEDGYPEAVKRALAHRNATLRLAATCTLAAGIPSSVALTLGWIPAWGAFLFWVFLSVVCLLAARRWAYGRYVRSLRQYRPKGSVDLRREAADARLAGWGLSADAALAAVALGQAVVAGWSVQLILAVNALLFLILAIGHAAGVVKVADGNWHQTPYAEYSQYVASYSTLLSVVSIVLSWIS